ncbi:DUF6766 family protein [Hymenobacter aerophilus]|uniref:DUF6766 family protein n=1 Tax=Hymenobacter aerophilus TaxID=119644 RepID=UPI00373FC948
MPGHYLHSGHLPEATFENWASDFLQLGAYVLPTIGLRPEGSPESKKITSEEDVARTAAVEGGPAQEGAGNGARGISMVNVLPCPSALTADSVP